ncbi:MAG: hypothetical protein JJU29_22650 [Verrucomicrobia bacterium]|nr:hypothetical protein [Verrucomicrobiota bacterium]MCH8514116.1 hypothetical protein [Kiritimatiellia bacterium]
MLDFSHGLGLHSSMAENKQSVAFALEGKRDGESASSDPGFADSAEKATRLDAQPGKAAFDEEEFNRAVELGTKAWADVPDIGAWVANRRGALPSQGKQEMCLADNVKMH